MFPKVSLDLVMLSIIDEHPDGVKGYAIMKELESRFGQAIAPGPGAFYPRLDRLKDEGFVKEQDKFWTVTPGGKKYLQEQAPELLDQSLGFVPQFYKFLMRAIPFGRRLDFLSKQSNHDDCRSCGPHPALFDADSIVLDLDVIPDEGKSINRLQNIKARLDRIKREAEEQMKAQLAAIDSVRKIIDEKIIRCETEKASWRRIPIEDGTFENTEKHEETRR